MAGNPVAANLLMFTLLLGGLLGFSEIRQEITPDFTLESIRVSVAYPGASPKEVEEGIVLAVEKELTGMDGIRSITSSANEGSGSVSAELSDDADPGEVLQNVRNAVSRITSFPDDAEPARVELRQHGFYVISIAVAATLPPEDLFALSERIRRELLNHETSIRGIVITGFPVARRDQGARNRSSLVRSIAARASPTLRSNISSPASPSGAAWTRYPWRSSAFLVETRRWSSSSTSRIVADSGTGS